MFSDYQRQPEAFGGLPLSVLSPCLPDALFPGVSAPLRLSVLGSVSCCLQDCPPLWDPITENSRKV